MAHCCSSACSNRTLGSARISSSASRAPASTAPICSTRRMLRARLSSRVATSKATSLCSMPVTSSPALAPRSIDCEAPRELPSRSVLLSSTSSPSCRPPELPMLPKSSVFPRKPSLEREAKKPEVCVRITSGGADTPVSPRFGSLPLVRIILKTSSSMSDRFRSVSKKPPVRDRALLRPGDSPSGPPGSADPVLITEAVRPKANGERAVDVSPSNWLPAVLPKTEPETEAASPRMRSKLERRRAKSSVVVASASAAGVGRDAPACRDAARASAALEGDAASLYS
mmetsp:Transcript_21769/g.39517  ORF Transcript_21769/g.39517 Transcript_21769/m.39517 type:complete len:284 (+) Transcript_21769:175-1026(+)